VRGEQYEYTVNLVVKLSGPEADWDAVAQQLASWIDHDGIVRLPKVSSPFVVESCVVDEAEDPDD
jgi:hypothetical protein